ncbi:MAG: NADH-quinone oxidoreductase subunit K [Candidatus Methylomirabilales bacterium]
MSDATGLEAIVALLLITDLLLLGSGRLRSCIALVGLQGIVVSLLPILLHGMDGRAWLLTLGSAALKGGVFPWLLLRVLRETGVRREVEPFVSHTVAVVVGVGALMFSLWVDARLGLPSMVTGGSSLVVPAGLATLLIGLFVIVSRRKALTQVVGYIVVENGSFTLGMALVGGVPMLVELGVLMDVFVAVFIMSIATYHISREFDHMDVDQLNQLKG